MLLEEKPELNKSNDDVSADLGDVGVKTEDPFGLGEIESEPETEPTEEE